MRTTSPARLTAAELQSISNLFKESFAANTHKAYRQAAERFSAFLGDREADDNTVAAFLRAEAERGLAPASLAIAAAAIGAAARLAGTDDPRGQATRRTLGSLTREGAGRGRGQVEGLKREHVAAAARRAEADGTKAGLRDAALLRLGSDGLLRISELAAVRVQDVELVEDGSGRLGLRRSKTDQGAEGETLYVCRATMAAIAAWREAAGIASGPLFRGVARNGGTVSDRAFSESSIRKAIQRRARDAGSRGRVSGHSLRVGGAQSLVAMGASTAELMQAGRWKDPKMAARYAANELAGTGAVARYFEDDDE